MNNPDMIGARVIHVRGTHYEMGLQHGQQVHDLRPAVQTAIKSRLAQLAEDGADELFWMLVTKTAEVVASADRNIVDMVRGLADGLDLPFETLFRYNLAAFLHDVLTTRRIQASEGCTTWAASGAATVGDEPILAKNRDYRLEHLPLQMVVHAEPAGRLRTLYVTSAGSPGVFVAGMNEAGLAIVDSHVPSSDIGPGLPAYALGLHILEEYEAVGDALSYIKEAPRLGRNNVVLADAEGTIAACEMGHHHMAVREAEAGILANTNHFLSPVMRSYYIDTDPPAERGNSQARYKKVHRLLTEAHGRIDLAWALNMMADHGGSQASLCRHPVEGRQTATIATIIFFPRSRKMVFAHGQPCTTSPLTFNLP